MLSDVARLDLQIVQSLRCLTTRIFKSSALILRFLLYSRFRYISNVFQGIKVANFQLKDVFHIFSSFFIPLFKTEMDYFLKNSHTLCVMFWSNVLSFLCLFFSVSFRVARYSHETSIRFWPFSTRIELIFTEYHLYSDHPPFFSVSSSISFSIKIKHGRKL